MRYLIGARLLNLNTDGDLDYLIISNEHDYKRIYEGDTDLLYVSEKHLNEVMNFNKDLREYAHIMVLNYQLDADIIGQNFPIEYHLLDHKIELIKLLKNVVKYKLLNMHENMSINNGMCPKGIYHIAYNVFILQNNSPFITPEQKEIIQKIHDKQMPTSFRKELINIINLL